MLHLKPRYEAFCQAFITYPNAKEAARSAGYSVSSCYNQGHRILHRPEIKERILDLNPKFEYVYTKDPPKEGSTDRFFIYFIAGLASDGLELCTPVKIGISNDVKSRLKQLQTSSWVPLEIIYSSAFSDNDTVIELEQTLHECLKEVNVSGEWFNLNRRTIADLSDFIESNKYKRNVGKKRTEMGKQYKERLQLCRNCLGNFINLILSKGDTLNVTQ